jgi:phosphomannomutase
MGKTLVLFDVDGTLTVPRKKINCEMLSFLKKLHNHVDIGVVGGSDINKIKEQLGDDVCSLDFIDFVFAENGLVAYKGTSVIHTMSIKEFLGEAKLKSFINFVLRYIADLDIPVKRGTFVEFRNGMLNVSPIGRNCSQEERDEFEQYDVVHKVRQTMVKVLQKEFEHLDLAFSIGGQISFDVFPKGWDKTYCLQFVRDAYDDIYFFGDKTQPGGNDYEIFVSAEVHGRTVSSPSDTLSQCEVLFMD